MKFFIAIALLAAAASARILPADLNLTPHELAEVEEILAAIHSPSTDPTTAAMLEEMLYQILGVAPPTKPIQIPALIDEYEKPIAEPALIDFPLPAGAIPVDSVPVSPVSPAVPTPAASSPLVQIIVNVNSEGSPVASPVQVDHVPSPVVVVDQPEVVPTPVHVVDHFEVEPSPVVVPEPVLIGHLPEAVAVAPIVVAPAVVGPEILN